MGGFFDDLLQGGLPSVLDSAGERIGIDLTGARPSGSPDNRTEATPPVNAVPNQTPVDGVPGLSWGTAGLVVGGIVAAVLLVKVLR